MKSFFLNLLLLVIVLVISYYTAPFSGPIYDYFSSQKGISLSSIGGKEAAVYFVGLAIAYVIAIPLLFQLFGRGNKKKWIFILLIPAALLWLSGDVEHIYLPIIASVIGWYIGFGLNKLLFKNRVSNSSSVK